MNNIRRDFTADRICVLTFDRAGSSANIFDRATLDELDAHLSQIGDARGLILTSAKDAIFIAGADLHSIGKMSAAELREFIELGQNVFNKIAALPIPTVAAVHGAAPGGGYEICLACDWRIASPDRATKLGLPETQLGILPAWGGCTRLPRLIGVPAALDIILAGKVVAAKHALKLGMIDEIAPRETLVRVAEKWIARGKHHTAFTHSAAVNTALDVYVGPKARADVLKRTRGHYPAVEKALEVVLLGASAWHEADSLARERAAIVELVQLDSTKNLLRLFFLQERAKKRTFPDGSVRARHPERSAAESKDLLLFPPTDAPRAGEIVRGPSTAPAKPGSAQDDIKVRVPEIARAAVIGAGIMGSGIAQWLSARGLRTILRDIDTDRVAAGMANVSKLYADGVKHRVFTANEARTGLERISPAAAEVPLRQTDLVIEAASEKMEIKKSIFRRLDEITRDDAILATNTSALSIAELASATKHPARVIGLHFFNPVHKMQLVEVVRGPETAPEVIQRALRFVQKIGKLPVLVKDSPGFLVNRILLPYMIEAGLLFEEGASIEEIDASMLDFGMPMGPLRLIDEVGVDISEDVAATLSAAFPDRMRVPEILPQMIRSGLLGRKAGQGFYVHKKGSEPEVNPTARALRTGSSTAFAREELQRRMVLLMVNEAARCLEEELVDGPADVDFAMVMGTGFAPFRGGPLRHADSVGTLQIAAHLTHLAAQAAPRFTPCELLRAMNGKPFYEN